MKHYKLTSNTPTIDSRGITHSCMNATKNRNSVERRFHVHCFCGLQKGDRIREALLRLRLRVCLWITGKLRFLYTTHAHNHHRRRLRRRFWNANLWRENQLKIWNRKNASLLHLQFAKGENLYRTIRRFAQLVLSNDLQKFQGVCLTEVAIESVQLQTHANDLQFNIINTKTGRYL